jgi:hypothetical protein
MTTWTKRTAALIAIATAAFALVGPQAEAGTSTGTFTVQTTVDAACTVTTQNLTFPNYVTGTSFNVAGSTNFTIACPGVSVTSPAPVTMTFTPSGGTFKMASGANTLNYQLCTDATCGTTYASATAGPSTNITANPATFTVFGQIPSGQSPPAGGPYTQSVTATLTY